MKEIVVGKITKEESNELLKYQERFDKIIYAIIPLSKKAEEIKDAVNAEMTKLAEKYELPKYRSFIFDHKTLEIKAKLYDWEKDINVPEED
jgi:hemerythrin superfamily protein